jgi:hypothetical protein
MNNLLRITSLDLVSVYVIGTRLFANAPVVVIVALLMACSSCFFLTFLGGTTAFEYFEGLLFFLDVAIL